MAGRDGNRPEPKGPWGREYGLQKRSQTKRAGESGVLMGLFRSRDAMPPTPA